MLKFETLYELGREAARAYPARNALGTRGTDGVWSWITFAERHARAERCAAALRRHGIRKGDRVAVVSKNRHEWGTLSFAASAAGAALVPMYEQQRPSEWEYIVGDSEAKVLVVSRQDLLSAAIAAAPNVEKVLCFDAPAGSDFCWDDAIAEDDAANAPSDADRPSPGDLASLIYTSGTTGRPKGVELTHDNIASNVRTLAALSSARFEARGAPPGAVQRSTSILPWAHIFGQTCEFYTSTALGLEIAVAEDATTLLRDMTETKPTLLFAVPALFNRIYDGFQQNTAAATPLKRSIAQAAVSVAAKKWRSEHFNAAGEAMGPSLNLIEKVQHSVLDKIVLSKVRAKLGGELKFCMNGGAAISTDVREFIGALGLTLQNGYGLTETSPVVTVENIFQAENCSPGSIGKVLPGTLVRIVDPEDVSVVRAANEPGELVCSGPGVLKGYWRNAAATAEVLFNDQDGRQWFRSGDMAAIDESGHVRLVGRIKEQYKLSNGKFVAPTPVEEKIARSRFVAQVFLYGDNQPHNVALVAPDWVAVAEHFGVAAGTITMTAPFTYEPQAAVEALQKDKAFELRLLLDAELREHGAACKAFEQPQRWALAVPGFTAGRGMLTPKMSVKRNVVLTQHADDLAGLYDGADADNAREAAARLNAAQKA